MQPNTQDQILSTALDLFAAARDYRQLPEKSKKQTMIGMTGELLRILSKDVSDDVSDERPVDQSAPI